jgi:mutator protein MutT
MKCVDVAIAVVRKDGKILICQRKNEDSLGGFWEFPGGKREAGETLEDCLIRELMEEVAIKVTVVKGLTPVRHDYGSTRVTLHPFLCDHAEGEPMAIECQKCEWILADQFARYKFPPANDSLLKEIAGIVSQ